MSLLAAACSSDDGGDTESTEAPGDTAAEDTAPEPTDTATEDTATEDTATEDTATEDTATEDTAGGEVAGSAAFPNLDPPTGEPIKIGLVNTEGTPGLDFPDIRLAVGGAADYLNQHGGMGGRPIELENCTANGSPETSQACAQELVGKDVEMVLLGLDLFPDYATYGAAGVPVVGMLPILPQDYTADALFLTGGNATTTASMAAVAKDYFNAETVGIVSADNAGANGTEAALTAALDKAGISHVTVKGGDNETDAGYQGLMREAAKDNPDLLVSLYSDAGCIGTMRARASLGIEIPVITTGICSSKEVIDEVGDDALGWNFAGVQTQEDTPELAILQEIMGPVLDVEPSEVDSTSLGLGGLGLLMAMSLATYSNEMADGGAEITGESIYQNLLDAEGLKLWPAGSEIACGSAETYPSVCSFTFPYAEYTESGEVLTIPGLEAVSALEYLP
jgi:branched-chain amino acid transport system substrate-binding protein